MRLIALSCAVLAAGVAAAAPASAAPKAAARARVTFGVEPATAHGLSALPHFAFGATPGATLTDHVAVLNYSAKPLTLQLYATDAVNTSTGGFGLLPATATPVGAGAWITLPKSSATVRVPAQTTKAPGRVIVPFTLKVPSNATPGDHVGGIVASLRTVGQSPSGDNVVLEQRAGTRLFVRVAGTLAPSLALTNLHASYHGTLDPAGRGAVTVTYQVKNTGNVELAVNQGVSISGLFGSRHVAVAAVPLLLPGDSLQETAHLSGVWPQLVVRAKVTALPHAVTGDTDPQLVAVTASTRLWAVPWSQIVLILLVIGGAWLAVVVRRGRSRGASAPSAPAERVSA